MAFCPASEIQDLWVFGEYGDVNPSVTDSSTYTFMSPDTMEEVFDHEIEGCFLYSRAWNPSNKYLCDALARIEQTEAAHVTASGMAAITSSIMQLCSAGDEVVSGWTIYGGTYAFLANFLPRFGVKVRFVDMSNADMVADAVTEKTKVVYCETISNPLLQVPDIPRLKEIASRVGAQLLVDNTFAPLSVAPAQHGADIILHSLTKFINGTSDCVAGVICSSKEFSDEVGNVNSGATMLLGPVLDSLRSASILKNLHTLHLRIRQHSKNALYLATRMHEAGLTIHYPGLPDHPQHQRITSMLNTDYGYGGMLVINAGDQATADRLMVAMQEAKVGYLAVSLGYFKTLFSAPAHSTSSEIPEATQQEMGLTGGMVRMSVGLDQDIERTWERIESCMKQVGLLN